LIPPDSRTLPTRTLARPLIRPHVEPSCPTAAALAASQLDPGTIRVIRGVRRNDPRRGVGVAFKPPRRTARSSVVHPVCTQPHECVDCPTRRPNLSRLSWLVALSSSLKRLASVAGAQLVNELVEAADERVLSRVVSRYGRLDLLLLDELGYVQIDPRGAELLFQIVTEREERASIAIATNLPFSEWGTVFPDPRLVAVIIDRVTFNAHILETGTQSYRLRTSKNGARQPRSS